MQKPDEKQESMTNYGWHALKKKNTSHLNPQQTLLVGKS